MSIVCNCPEGKWTYQGPFNNHLCPQGKPRPYEKWCDGCEFLGFTHRFLCCNQETYEPLIWQQYGYWHLWDKKTVSKPPEWATLPEVFARVKHLIANIKEPDLQVAITTKQGEMYDHGNWTASWKLFDPNNPHIEPDTGGVAGCRSEQAAIDYAQQRYYELKRLYDGDVEALLVCKNTGIPCLPNWNSNKIDSFGYKEVNGKIVKSRVPRAREVQIGTDGKPYIHFDSIKTLR